MFKNLGFEANAVGVRETDPPTRQVNTLLVIRIACVERGSSLKGAGFYAILKAWVPFFKLRS